MDSEIEEFRWFTTYQRINSQLTDEKNLPNLLLMIKRPLRRLVIHDNLLGDASYLAIAAALRSNTSLYLISMYNNRPVDRARIDAAFADNLEMRSHHAPMQLFLYSPFVDDYPRLARCPSMLQRLSRSRAISS